MKTQEKTIIENEIKSVIEEKVTDGTIEKAVSEAFEKCVQSVCENLFRSYGDIGKVIEEKLKAVMLPSVEGYDYSRFIPKMDTLLTEIINSTSLSENKTILENFKELMIEPDKKEITLSELFKEYRKYVAECVDTDKLEVTYDDGPCYESVEVGIEIEIDENYSRNAEKAIIKFYCEEDSELNKTLELRKWNDSYVEGWRVIRGLDVSIMSLRYTDKFDVLMFKLDRANTEIEINMKSEAEYVTPDKKPELSYS